MSEAKRKWLTCHSSVSQHVDIRRKSIVNDFTSNLTVSLVFSVDVSKRAEGSALP